MKIEKLYYFLSVAKHLNFTRAAQECHIAQPAISEQISSLEKELGVQLFERGARSIRLTAEGEVFYQHISRFVQNYEQSLREVRTSLQEKSLVIGVNHFNLPRLLSGAVRRLQERFPSIRVEYRTACAFAPETFSAEDGCDVVFTWGEQSNLPGGIAEEVLLSRPAVALLYEGHPLAVNPVLTREQLSHVQMIVPVCQHCRDFTAFYLRRMEQLHVKMGRKALAQDAASMLLMLESGAGITVGPQGAFQENGHLAARTIEGCGEFGSWRALFRRGKVNPLVGALLDIIKEMDKRDGD